MKHTAVLLGYAAPALAQAQSTAPQAAATDETGLGEIVVPAQKRAERVEDVPIAIASIFGDTLSASGIAATVQLPQMVPSLRIDYSGAFAQPTIRGVSSATSGNGLVLPSGSKNRWPWCASPWTMQLAARRPCDYWSGGSAPWCPCRG